MKKSHKHLRLSGNSTDNKSSLQSPHSEDEGKIFTDPEEITTQLWNRLIGNWVGMRGFNLIAVPAPKTQPDTMANGGSFALLTSSYVETLSFSNPGAPAPNRGGDTNQFVAALEYHQRVTAQPGQTQVKDDENIDLPIVDPKDIIPVFEGELMHVENGMFLNLSKIVSENDKENLPMYNIARSGTVPHGNSIMLLGTPPSFTLGGPGIQTIDALPTPKDRIAANFGSYKARYGGEFGGVRPKKFQDPSLVLKSYLDKMKEKGHHIKNTISFSFDSDNDGGIFNIPFLQNRANTKRMQAFFWLETVRIEKTGQEYDQLQYMQIMDIEFQKTNEEDPKKRDFVTWPHVTVNTLVKQ